MDFEHPDLDIFIAPVGLDLPGGVASSSSCSAQTACSGLSSSGTTLLRLGPKGAKLNLTDFPFSAFVVPNLGIFLEPETSEAPGCITLDPEATLYGLDSADTTRNELGPDEAAWNGLESAGAARNAVGDPKASWKVDESAEATRYGFDSAEAIRDGPVPARSARYKLDPSGTCRF